MTKKTHQALLAPIPRDHVARQAGISWELIRKLIRHGELQALELVQEEQTLETKLVPYVPNAMDEARDAATPQSLFIAPDVAVRFVEQRKGEASHKIPRSHNMIVPIPISHIAKRAGIATESIQTAIKYGRLQAMEFVQDEQTLESKLVPYVPQEGVSRQGQALYVLPDVAEHFVASQQKKRETIEEKRGTDKPEHITPELQDQILQIARELKEKDPDSRVERIKILEAISGKRNNMYLYRKIRYVMDQHLEEFPPKHPNQLGDKLTEQGRAKKLKRG